MGLTFKFGTMGSGKTLELLSRYHNYDSKNVFIRTVVPSIDVRYGAGVIKSRAGLEIKADICLDKHESVLDKVIVDLESPEQKIVLLADEAQFFSCTNVESFRQFADRYSAEVVCYGIRTDFLGELFEGSRRLFELADYVEALHTTCWYCNDTALFNLRIDTFSKDKILLGDSEKYREVCSRCYALERGTPWE